MTRLLSDHEVAALLGYRDAAAFRRHRKQLEAQGFPQRRPIVRRYSPREIEVWIDGRAPAGAASAPDPLGDLAGEWGKSP